MKTLVDLCKLSDLNCGLGQVALNLYRELKKDESIGFYIEENSQNLIEARAKIYQKWHRLLYFPGADVWHAIHQDIKVYPPLIRKVLTIHDLNAIYETEDPEKKKKYLAKLQKKIDSASAITYISKFTQREVHEHLKIRGQLEAVIPNGVCLDHDIKPKRPQNLPEHFKDFFFSIGTVVPKKNFKLILKIAQKREYLKFVIAGPLFHEYAKEILEEINDLDLGDRVVLLGPVSEEEKVYLYDKAQALFHPSFLEGFGLPIVEAFSRGLPVVSSNACSLPEVCGIHGHMFDPRSLESALLAIDEFLKSAPNPNVLKDYAREFSWEKAAKSYQEVYKKVRSNAL